MANHKSAVKRAKQNEQRRMRNRARKSRMKTAIKAFEEAVAGNNPELAQAKLREAVSIIDKTKSKGVVHRNTAARKISRLTRRCNRMVRSETV